MSEVSEIDGEGVQLSMSEPVTVDKVGLMTPVGLSTPQYPKTVHPLFKLSADQDWSSTSSFLTNLVTNDLEEVISLAAPQ
eukprot:scaffold48235_cov27-Tisochrysis_lutea.AAC.1